MFDLGPEWWSIVARTAIVYLALLGGLRLAGNRELGQMTPFDLVVILLIANALQNAMVGPDTSVTGGLIAAGVLLGMNALLSRFRRRLPWVRHIAEGEPVLVVSDGSVLESRLHHLGLQVADLEQAAARAWDCGHQRGPPSRARGRREDQHCAGKLGRHTDNEEDSPEAATELDRTACAQRG